MGLVDSAIKLGKKWTQILVRSLKVLQSLIHNFRKLIVSKMEVELKQAELENICTKILNLDSKIRFVEIVYKDKIASKTRPDLEKFLNPSETSESIDDSLARWATRTKLAPKLGEPLYAFAEYGKVKRLTIPLGNGGLILVSMDPRSFHEIIIKEILGIRAMLDFTIPNDFQKMTQEKLINHLCERFGLPSSTVSVIFFTLEKYFSKVD